MPIATRLTNTGTLLVNGIFDENTSFSLVADVLVVGGGGAGGHLGGGGAGGHRYFTNQSLVSATNYTVTVGAGGSASTGATGNQGSNSVFDTYTSAGGGGGAGEAALPAAGGSGGGGGGISGTSRPGAAGNTPSTSPSQGNAGGNGNDNGAGTAFAGGGGGGAGGIGNNAPGTTTAGDGGLGTANSITGTSVTRAAGGGGGAYQIGSTATAGTGGSSIGGNGGRNGLNATSGSPNTGSGGGGNGLNSSGNLQGLSGGGGSGVVILKYPNTFTISNSGGGLTFTTDSSSVAGYNITTFTAGTGQISFTALTKFRTTSNTVFAGTLDEFTGAPVVDSSLKLWLDAAQTTSYSGSGTTWTDLSGSGNNGTLTGGPTFSSVDGGSIVLDGTDDYTSISNNSLLSFGTNSFTINLWIRRISGSSLVPIITSYNDYNSGYSTYFFAGIYVGAPGSYYDGFTLLTSGGSYITSLLGIPITNNEWINVSITRSGGDFTLYKNGSIHSTASSTGLDWSGTGRPTLIGGGVAGISPFNGNISDVQIYNRALTAAEIAQNYNALQSRYGLASITATQMPVVQRQLSSGTLLVNGEFDEFTGAPVVDSNLKLWLDAAQTTSYPGTGTTWTDLSGSGFNGTLTSGPTFSSADGGSIVFDGTDDHVLTGFIDIISGNNVTVEVWVNCGSSQNQYANILDFNHSNLGFVIQQDSTTLNTFYFAYHNGIGYEITPTITLPTNTWCQLVFVKSGTSTIGYLNSVNTVSYTGSANIASTVLNLALGRWLGGGGREFNGKISNTKLYNRALTADEITTNFNALRRRYGI